MANGLVATSMVLLLVLGGCLAAAPTGTDAPTARRIGGVQGRTEAPGAVVDGPAMLRLAGEGLVEVVVSLVSVTPVPLVQWEGFAFNEGPRFVVAMPIEAKMGSADGCIDPSTETRVWTNIGDYERWQPPGSLEPGRWLFLLYSRGEGGVTLNFSADAHTEWHETGMPAAGMVVEDRIVNVTVVASPMAFSASFEEPLAASEEGLVLTRFSVGGGTAYVGRQMRTEIRERDQSCGVAVDDSPPVLDNTFRAPLTRAVSEGANITWSGLFDSEAFVGAAPPTVRAEILYLH